MRGTPKKNVRDRSSDRPNKPKDERDILNQGFLPEAMDGLKLVQNCAWIVYTLFKGPERS